jgi:hypothetical protein
MVRRTYTQDFNDTAARLVIEQDCSINQAVNRLGPDPASIGRGRDRPYGRPPRRSVRAELPHTALTSGDWRRTGSSDTGAGSWGGVTSDRRVAGSGPTLADDAGCVFAVRAASLAGFRAKRFQGGHVARNCVVVELALHHASRPLALLEDRLVTPEWRSASKWGCPANVVIASLRSPSRLSPWSPFSLCAGLALSTT